MYRLGSISHSVYTSIACLWRTAAPLMYRNFGKSNALTKSENASGTSRGIDLSSTAPCCRKQSNNAGLYSLIQLTASSSVANRLSSFSMMRGKACPAKDFKFPGVITLILGYDVIKGRRYRLGFKVIVPGVNYWLQFREKMIETGKRNNKRVFLFKKKKRERRGKKEIIDLVC